MKEAFFYLHTTTFMKKFYIPVLGFLLLALQPALAQNPSQKNSLLQSVLSKRTLISAGTTGSPAFSVSTVREGNGFVADRCGYKAQFNRAVASGYNKAAFEAIINQKVEEIKAARAAGNARFANYTIPVVFHIIHDGTAEGSGANVTAAQVYQQIDQLNKDFGNLSGSPFPAAASAGITFCPVTVDASGNVLAQPGINRINRISRGWTDPTTFTNYITMINYIDATIKPASIWDPTRFVNIWSYNFINSGLLGYATFPTAGLPDLPGGETATTAGCVFLTGSLGSVASPGTAGNYALGRTVGHEIGHFLGLYHIWGDEVDCSGSDLCADTPPCSDEFYSTVPGCTAPTQCSGQRRMIENYMDYSDDGCMNTYTQNQVDRIQAVMLAAPRRPGTSTLCTPPVANALNYITAATNTTEAGTTGTTCPLYTDYVISVKPATAASGNATVNFTLGGTATQNSDYTIIGSTTLNYTNGDGATKGFTIRVADDGAAEPTETIIINYAITGSGLVNGSSTTHTVTIQDNDVTLPIDNLNPVTTLLSQNFGTTAASGALPAGWQKGQFLPTAGINAWTVNGLYGSSTGFTTGTNGRVLHITNANATAQTNETADAIYTANSESDAIAITPSINTSGYRNIKLSFDYAAMGEFDVDDIYDLGILRYSIVSQTTDLIPVTGGPADTVTLFYNKTAKTSITVNLPSATANVANLWIGFEWINDNSVRGLPPFIIDNVVITGERSGVETVLNQSATVTQNSGQTAQYMSNTSKIIASINDLNQNVGCITANIASQGDGFTVLTTNTGVYSRSNKVINLSPATANTTATYQATFYFTTSELATWGGSAPNLKLMKVANGVNLGSVLTGANSQVVAATFDDQRATRGYASYTGSFTGGFSQFMLVSPTTTLPVSTLTFEARPNGKNILLNWSTATEINNKGFVIERSTDGSHFETIGWINGAMNSSEQKNYSYTDNFVQPNQLYYYRLRQTDIDSRESLSAIRQARINDRAVLQVSISPNPASNEVKVFTSGTAGLSNINLLDAKGQLVKTWKQVNCSAAPQSLDISKIAAGVYMIQVVTGDTITAEKLIIN